VATHLPSDVKTGLYTGGWLLDTTVYYLEGQDVEVAGKNIAQRQTLNRPSRQRSGPRVLPPEMLSYLRRRIEEHCCMKRRPVVLDVLDAPSESLEKGVFSVAPGVNRQELHGALSLRVKNPMQICLRESPRADCEGLYSSSELFKEALRLYSY
jgi:hypothetical protein